MKLSNIIKIAGLSLASALVVAALAGCSAQGGDAASKTIKVGASPSPHAGILEAAKPALEKEGYKLDVVEYNDYVIPNEALSNGEIDANFFQHLPYLENYNSEKGTDLVSVGTVHFEPLKIFAGKSNDLKNVAKGAKISIPADATNGGRALLLLQDQGLIKLKDGAGLTATKNDIVENPYNLDIIEADAASLPRTLEDVDFAVINGNFAISAGLDKSKVLASETEDSAAAKTYANLVAVKAQNKDSEKAQALIKALQSDAVRDYIKTTYGEEVIPVFNA